ncbi:MAG TPA: helix-turn-helix transcriptional regulator, partial [Acidimicrobiia bacterium]
AVDAYRAAGRERADQEEPLLGATVRLEAAEVLSLAGDEAAAITEARAALAVFERLGAARDTDRATAFLRGLGAAGHTRLWDRAGAIGALSGREREILALLGQDLTNAEIAQRLDITAKTVEHHVGRILTKLGARSRTEAAAMATAEAV